MAAATALPVEGSWRMVEGDNDSFETSVVPDHEGVRVAGGVGGEPSSQESSQGAVIAAGGGGSQDDDDIRSFLRKAEDDERVLLRSPFQPSVPSSVRQSYQTQDGSEFFCMPMAEVGPTEPTVEAESSLQQQWMDSSADSAAAAAAAAAAASATLKMRQRPPFTRVSDTGSFAPRQRGGRHYGSDDVGSAGSSPVSASASASARHGRPSFLRFSWPLRQAALWTLLSCLVLVALSSRYPGVPLSSPSSSSTSPSSSSNGSGSTFSSPSFTHLSLADKAAELMGLQAQLAVLVRDRLTAESKQRDRVGSVPESTAPGLASTSLLPAQDAWVVPRARTKALRLTVQQEQRQKTKQHAKNASSSLASRSHLQLLELDAYLEAAKRVSLAMTRLQTGAAAISADALMYSSRRALAQLRRMAAEAKKKEGKGNSSRSFSAAQQQRRRAWLLLEDTYRRHTSALAAKTGERVAEARRVLAALSTAATHLDRVQAYAESRCAEILGQKGAGGGPERRNEARGGGGGERTKAYKGQFAEEPYSLLAWLRGLYTGMPVSSAPAGSGSGPRPAPPPVLTKKAAKTLRQWRGHEAELREVRVQHDDTTQRIQAALAELLILHDALLQLQAQMGEADDSGSSSGSSGTTEAGLDVWLHTDIVEAGIRDLQDAGGR